jgi:hypothetical protein
LEQFFEIFSPINYNQDEPKINGVRIVAGWLSQLRNWQIPEKNLPKNFPFFPSIGIGQADSPYD